VIGRPMLERLGGEVFGSHRPEAVLAARNCSRSKLPVVVLPEFFFITNMRLVL